MKLLHTKIAEGVTDTGDMNYVISIIRKAATLADKTELVKKALKLNEESGELAAEVLKDCGYKDSDLSKSEIRSRIIEEAVDSLVMVVDILNDVEATDAEIIDCAEFAVTKWLDRQQEKREKEKQKS